MKITKSQLRRIIKEELEVVQELYGRAGAAAKGSPSQQSGRYEEERCVSCVQDINRYIKSSGYEIIMLETYPVQYQLKPLTKQPSEPLPADVQKHLDNMVNYDPPFEGGI